MRRLFDTALGQAYNPLPMNDSRGSRSVTSESASSGSGWSARTAIVLRWLVMGASVWYIGSYIAVALLRIG